MAGSITNTSATTLTDNSTYTADASALGFIYCGGSGGTAQNEKKSSTSNITYNTGNIDGGPGASGGTKINFTGGDGTITGTGIGVNLTTCNYANPGTSGPPTLTIALESTSQSYTIIGGYSSSNTTSQNSLGLRITANDGSFSTTVIYPTVLGSLNDTDVKFQFDAQGNSNGQTLLVEWNEYSTSVAYKTLRWAEFKATASSGSTGTAAVTEGADTSSASGTTTIVGQSATTNAADTSSASGTTTVIGATATTNAADTSAASGTTTILGTSATTNAADTSNASGSVGSAIIGTANIIEQADTANATGTTVVVGTSATTNNADTANASGWAGAVVGTAAILEQADTCVAYGSTTAPVVLENNSGGYEYWNPAYLLNRKRKEINQADIPKAAKKAIKIVAGLNLPKNDAEIALRLRTQQLDWQQEYIRYATELQQALEQYSIYENSQLRRRLAKGDFIAQQKALEAQQERNRRISLVMQLI